MVLWDCVSLFDAEEEKDLKHEDILETNVTTRSQGLIKESIKDYPEQSREKIVGRKDLLFTKPKEKQSPDFEGMAKMMQKLSNKIIDLEKEKEAQKFYKPYYKKREDNNQSQPPPHSPASMNLTEVGMDNFCTFHQ